MLFYMVDTLEEISQKAARRKLLSPHVTCAHYLSISRDVRRNAWWVNCIQSGECHQEFAKEIENSYTRTGFMIEEAYNIDLAGMPASIRGDGV